MLAVLAAMAFTPALASQFYVSVVTLALDAGRGVAAGPPTRGGAARRDAAHYGLGRSTRSMRICRSGEGGSSASTADSGRAARIMATPVGGGQLVPLVAR